MIFKIDMFSSFCWFLSVGLAVVLVASCGPVRIGGGGDDDDWFSSNDDDLLDDDDDVVGNDDDDAASDDDDAASDDDDAASDDDDTAPDDDDAASDDDDTAPDDDDTAPDDDDTAPDDDDTAPDDDDAAPDDDDAVSNDDDAVSNDDDDDSVPSGSCVDDAWEDNDSVATPSLLGPGTTSGLHACDGDEDYFSISLAAGDELTVNVLFSHVEGDIDAQLQNSAGSVVLESAYSTNDNETLGPYVAAFGGVVMLRVHLYSDAGGIEGNPYDLDVSITSSP